MIYIFYNVQDFASEFAEYYALDAFITHKISKVRGRVSILEDANYEDILKSSLMGKRVGVDALNVPDIANKLLKQREVPVAKSENYIERIENDFSIKPINQEFYRRDAREVAISLLGKLLVVREKNETLIGKIVETEAYFGDKDPASRAYHGKKSYNSGMWLEGGHIFIYMVHANWMFNITTDHSEPQAVLIRAVEPLIGIKSMKLRRNNRKTTELCNGPGKWSRAFGIRKEHNGMALRDEIFVAESPWTDFDVARTGRIGVREDLDEPLRFYIKNSKFVSKTKIK